MGCFELASHLRNLQNASSLITQARGGGSGFSASEWDWVLFFPGLVDSYDTISVHAQDERGLYQRAYRQMKIDHISLENNLRSMHLTAPQSRQHYGQFSIPSLGEGRCLWFGVSIQNPQVLRPLMKQTVVIASVPSTDSRRRVDEFFKDARRTGVSRFGVTARCPSSTCIRSLSGYSRPARVP